MADEAAPLAEDVATLADDLRTVLDAADVATRWTWRAWLARKRLERSLFKEETS